MSIDLQLSRSFNSPTLHCYSYEPGSHYLLSNQSNRTVCCTINLLPRSRSHYFSYLCKCFELLPGTTSCTRDYLPNGRSNIEHRSYRTSNIDEPNPTVRTQPYEPNLLLHFQTDGRSNIDRIEHRSHRTSVASNIDHIEHRSHRTLIEPNPTIRTRPPSFKYQTNRTSSVEHRKSNIEHRSNLPLQPVNSHYATDDLYHNQTTVRTTS
jgi:hypothetical protein